MRQNTKWERGFSFVELMIVVGIITLLSALSFMSVNLVRKERVGSAARQMLGELQGARMDGMTTGPSGTAGPLQFIRGAGLRLVSPTRYVTFKFNDCSQDYTYDDNGCSGAREESDARTFDLRSGIEIMRDDSGTLVAPADSAVDDVLLFDHLGMARKNDWGQISSTPFVVVLRRQSGDAKCIFVSANKIREGSWNGASCSQK